MIIESSFQPPWWLRNPHIQTLWSPVFRQIKPVDTRIQRLELTDGDFIDLEWLVNDNIAPTAPIMLLLHGLEGSADSVYIQNLLQNIKPQNWHTLVMNFRSCSKELNRLPKSYHSGETEDLSHVLKMLRERLPESTIMAAGFSLGGNALLKYLGENKQDSLIDIAAAVSVPFLLSGAAIRMDVGFSRFYRNRLIKELKNKTRKKVIRHSDELADLAVAIDDINTFFEFDDQITAPLHGFNGAKDYYQKCSSRQFLKTISKPTLILHALDDPFMTEDVIPHADELSSTVTLELSKGGGHVGFVEGNLPWKTHSYIDKKIPSWFVEQLAKNNPD